MKINSRRIFAVMVLAIMALPTLSQTRIFSPYSRYGLGDISPSTHGYYMAMGGLTLPDTDPSHINFANPASYAWADSLSFVFETGISSLGVDIQSSDVRGQANYTSLNGLQMAFPVTPWWGSSIGLIPYSDMGYNLTYDEELDTIGKVRYTFEGYGGLNHFYFGNSFKPAKNLSIGVNVSYLFGNLNKVQLVNFDSANYFDLKHNQSTIVGDFYFDFGAQYKWKISDRDPLKVSDDIWLDIGLVFGAPTNIRAREDILTQRVLSSGTGYDFVKDTVLNIEGQASSLSMPMKYGAGLSLRYGDKWIVGTQYLAQDWSDFSIDGVNDSLGNSYEVNLGAQYIPDLKGSGYANKIRYRAGLRYRQTYLNLQGQPLSEYGISFGLGFPLRNTGTTLNLAVELGKRGTTDQNLLLENYGRITFGVSVFERWFMKPKYD